jgi:surface antigen
VKHALAALIAFTGMIYGSSQAYAINCVAYVQSVTDFSIMGDAWQWWGAAEHRYQRGYAPAPGAVMVFSRTGRMHVGHVAVVRQLRGPREVIIDQANWHHGRIDRGVSIHDLSPANDWSSVEVEWSPGVYGGPFPITGFVYAPGTPFPTAQSAVYTAERERAPRLVEASSRLSSGHLIFTGGLQAQAALHRPAATHAPSHPTAHRGGIAIAHHAAVLTPAVAHKPQHKSAAH